jgi:hypothetical protein
MTSLDIMLPEGRVPWGLACITDKDGIAIIEGVGARWIDVLVYLREHAISQTTVDLNAGRGEPIDVVVDASGSLDLTVLDGDIPLGNVWVGICRTQEGPPVLTTLTDVGGKVDAGELTPGNYVAIVTSPGVWPSHLELEARRETPKFEMQVRRLGSVSIQVRRSGQVVPGASLDLVSGEFGESVSEWVAAGRVKTSTTSLVTDDRGELVVYGIPHGTYSWESSISGSPVGSGQVVIEPREVSPLLVDLP